MVVKTFASLLREVVRKGLCVGCGACAASCPLNSVEMIDQEPRLTGICLACQTCYHQCPRAGFSTDDAEMAIFGRLRGEDEPVGVYRSAYVARSRMEDVLHACQDGGAVTSILAYALDSKAIDCAVVTDVDRERPWRPVPTVARTVGDLVRCAGTKYSTGPTLLGLASAVIEHGRERVAVVGTPCQVRAVRRMQTSPMGALRLGDAVRLTIGLFCMESYGYDGLCAFLRERGIDIGDVTRFAIRRGRFTAYKGSEIAVNVPVREAKHLAREACRACADFSAELADVSVGGVGAPDGWSTVIVRTEEGERLVTEALKAGYLELKPIAEAKPGMRAVVRLSSIKGKAPSPA
ncbi:TPA: coenzyme F420 hydrogenase [Candidatus Bathyarchaeota archaeon]|nr:coenzyme F420 hydrogenase [Candidatus Bathyarchaeota archaeon]